jgi:cation:H+ antiporter
LAALLGGARLATPRLLQAGSVLRTSTPVLCGTLVAFATALPALVSAVVAARRGRSNLALGIAVGFVLFNVLVVIGAVAMIEPLPLTTHAVKQEIPAVALFVLLLLPVVFNGLRVPRWEGALLFVCYAGFVVWQATRVRS